jgi:hypothetical protein
MTKLKALTVAVALALVGCSVNFLGRSGGKPNYCPVKAPQLTRDASATDSGPGPAGSRADCVQR